MKKWYAIQEKATGELATVALADSEQEAINGMARAVGGTFIDRKHCIVTVLSLEQAQQLDKEYKTSPQSASKYLARLRSN